MKVIEGFHSHGGSQLSSIYRWSVHESIQLPAMAPDEALAVANGEIFLWDRGHPNVWVFVAPSDAWTCLEYQ